MPPREFIDIALQLFGRHLVVVADEAPLQQCPEAFNTVRMRLVAHILTHGVVHCLVRPVNPLVGAGLVRVERRTVCGVIVHETLQRGLVGVLHHLRHDFPRGAIPDTSNGGFATAPPPALSFFLACLFFSFPPM